jgi:hypothetical protein
MEVEVGPGSTVVGLGCCSAPDEKSSLAVYDCHRIGYGLQLELG